MARAGNSLASKPGLSALSTFAEAIRPKRPLSQASANAGPSIPILAPLPEGIDGHFDPELRRFVLMQYHQGQSTLPRLGDFLRSVGMAISNRQLRRLLTNNKKASLADPERSARRTGTSPLVSVDDTGARHAEKNGFLYTDRQPLVHLVRHPDIEEPSGIARSAMHSL